jgi:TP53 regulating kinase-like protein
MDRSARLRAGRVYPRRGERHPTVLAPRHGPDTLEGWSDSELIYRGAEADLYSGRWGREDAVFKFRKPLAYRLEALDAEIRGQRTVREAELLHASRLAGVRTPLLYYVSPKEFLIVMRRIEGSRLKSLLTSPVGGVDALSSGFGAAVGRLHNGGVMHGDLTTSNVMVDGAGEIYLIDFGLAIRSTKVEDHAVDIRLIKETVVGAHPEVSSAVMKAFLAGYGAVVGEGRAKQVASKLVEIERRGRYARVD